MIIVSDASPLIGLARIDQLELLNNLFEQVIIPPAVAVECTSLLHKPGASAIKAAIDQLRITIFDGAFDLVKNLSNILGPGEVEAISLAKTLASPLLIDERLGRQAAQKCNIDVIGIGGLLITAKKREYITEVKPLLNELTENGYRISDTLCQLIIKKANET